MGRPGDQDDDYPFLQKRDVHELTAAIRAHTIAMTHAVAPNEKSILTEVMGLRSDVQRNTAMLERLLEVLVGKATNGDADALSERAAASGG